MLCLRCPLFTLAEKVGFTQLLRTCRPARPFSGLLDRSLLESPPDFLSTVAPFRLRIPLFLQTKNIHPLGGYFSSLAEKVGFTQLLRTCRPARPFSGLLDRSLLESPPDFLSTVAPFRLRIPLFLQTKNIHPLGGYFSSLAEKVGFEPTWDCSQTDFESAPL